MKLSVDCIQRNLLIGYLGIEQMITVRIPNLVFFSYVNLFLMIYVNLFFLYINLLFFYVILL